jgi:release factor glutamine methyltransferase
VRSIAQARRALAAQLRDAGLDSPELDARILIGHALGMDHTALVAAAEQPLGANAAADIARLAARRLAGEPVARIVGTKEFWGLSFIVTPAVLVPRPETETVVELALALIDRQGERTRALRIADLGTGSGALLLALLTELPNARGIGTDIDAQALAVAQRNAARLGLAARVAFLRGDYASALQGPFDLIVSNPPYVASRDIQGLAPEVRHHDPPHALDGGADGLAAYRAIAADAPRLLGRGGRLVVEIGAGQQRDVEALFTKQGLAITAARHDLSGIVRTLAADLPHT